MPVHRRPTFFVGYARVSRRTYAAGLDRQRALIEAYVEAAGGQLIGAYSEVRSDEQWQCEERERAIQFALNTHAILLVTRADRFTRWPTYFDECVRKGLVLRLTSAPAATVSQIGMLIASAGHREDERSIGSRIGLAMARAKGRIGGDPSRGSGRTARAEEHARQIRPIIYFCQRCGIDTLAALARELERLERFPTG